MVERRGTSATPGEDRPTAAQDDRRAWRQTLEWAAEVRLYQNGAWRHVLAAPHPAKWNMADAIDDSVNEGLCSANPDLGPTKHENQAAYPDAPVWAGRLAGRAGASNGWPSAARWRNTRTSPCAVCPNPVRTLFRQPRHGPDPRNARLHGPSTVVDAALQLLSGRSVGADALAPRACGARAASIPQPKGTSIAQSCPWPQACCRTPPRRTASRVRRSSDTATIEARAQESAEQGKEHVALPDPRGRASAATASANGRRPRHALRVCSSWEDVVKMISTVF